MAVTRINEFQAREGQGDMLRDRLRSVVPIIESSAGCRSCQLLQDLDDPTRLVVIEVWDSTEAHSASVRNILPEALAEMIQLLAVPPRGRYYRA